MRDLPVLLLSWRFVAARPLRSALSAVSIVLGVGLMAALLTLNTSMEASVEAYLKRTYGAYDLMAGYRKPGLRLSEPELGFIAGRPGVEAAAGVLIPYMMESHSELARLRLSYYGAPATELGRQYMPLKEGSFPGPGEAAVSEAWAKQNGVAVGEALQLPFPPHGARPVRISGLLPTLNQAAGGFALFERTWLEQATGRPGATFVLLRTSKKLDVASLTNALLERFPELEVDRRKFMDAARKNLNSLRPVALGMGLAALLASAFLLTGAFRMSLAERVRELALLRAVGAQRAQVRRLVLAEGLMIGGAGSVFGALLGAGAAALSAGAAARLMQTDPVPPVIPWGALAAAAAGGLLLALAAALGVARAAGRTEPLRAMRPDLPAEEREARQGGLFGMLLLGAGALALAVRPVLPETEGYDFLPPLVGSTGGLAVALGLLLGIRRLLPILLPFLALPFRRMAEAPVAVRGLLRHRRRSGNSVGAMGLGLILVIGILTLSSSLVDNWYRQVREEHPADMQLEVPYVFERGVNPDLARRVAAVPGVTAVGTIGEGDHVLVAEWDWSKADAQWKAAAERWNSRWWKGYESLWVKPADLPALVKMGVYKLQEGSIEGWGEASIAFTRAQAGQLGARVGDTLVLNLNQAIGQERASRPELRTYTVAAVLGDSYKLPGVVVGAPLPGAPGYLTAVYANADPGMREAARLKVRGLVQEMEYTIAEYSDFETATAELRSQVGQRLALLLAVAAVLAAVAAMSLVNTMVSSVAERRREFALLRAVGATPAQVRNLVLLEAALLGLVGGMMGVAGGAVLGAAALTGLEMALGNVRLPWAAMGAGLAASVALACLAALGPARRIARLAPAESVRAE